jgi:hypothetical protein
MILLCDRTTGNLLGEISKQDFTVIQEILEEENESDVDYYIQETALELLSQAGLSPDAHLLLTNALGDHADLEFGWEQPIQSATAIRGTILTEAGSRPAVGLAVEAREGHHRFWTFTRENGGFELRLPDQDANYTVRVAAIGDQEIWADQLEVSSGEVAGLGELTLEFMVEQG